MTANIVGGDLYHLWRVSEVHLPRVADVYYDAYYLLGGAQSDGSAMFYADAPAYPGATAMVSSAGAAWASLRDELMRMYAQTGDTTLGAAQGLREARQAYVETDQANADALSTYLADPNNHDPNNLSSNPPKPGDPDYPRKPSEEDDYPFQS